MASTAAMQAPAQSYNLPNPIVVVREEEDRPDILTAEIKTLKAVPTHNGHGSVGDEKEPAWFARRSKIVRGFLKWPPMPPNEVLMENFRLRSEEGAWPGVVFKLKGATEPGIPYGSNWRRLALEALESPREPVGSMLTRAGQPTAPMDQYVRIYLRVSVPLLRGHAF